MKEPRVSKRALIAILGLTETGVDDALKRGAPGGPGGYQVGSFLAWLLMDNGVGHAKAV